MNSAAHASKLSPPSFPGDDDNTLRPPQEVMRFARIGAFHQTRISFVRSLVRRMAQQRWRIERVRFELDDCGYGCAVYRLKAPRGHYSFVAFSQQLAPQERSDRVIAEKWDTAFALCIGDVDEERLQNLRANVPLQERGCFGAADLVVSRANKSVRLFEEVVAALVAGRQPQLNHIARVGYLLRTTAVYGNGKFGLADYHGVCDRGDFDTPFSAQLFLVYMVRHFSLELVEHIARCRAAPAVPTLDPALRRFFGVGNATGLGMAPFLIHHPRLLHRWLCNRERALAWVRRQPAPAPRVRRFTALLERAIQHSGEIEVDDAEQRRRNRELGRDLSALRDAFFGGRRGEGALLKGETPLLKGETPLLWHELLSWSERHAGLEAQEALVSLVLEPWPEIDVLEQQMSEDDHLRTEPGMSPAALKALIERNYGWALGCDYDSPEQSHVFWYRSEEKDEPRLGERRREPGAELEVALDVARRVAELHQALAPEESAQSVAEWALQHPQLRGIVRRVQGLAAHRYGEIQENLISARCRPLDLLRCKLSMFGAGKFDPKSNLWTRITLFQGAPLLEELEQHADDWAFPCRPPDSGAGAGENGG